MRAMAGHERFQNDNVRTEHLKCSICRTQIYLAKIEKDADGCELRSFACPHCAAVTTLRLQGA